MNRRNLPRRRGTIGRVAAPRRPEPIGEVLSELMIRRGYARLQARQLIQDAWLAAAGEAATHTRVGRVHRGVLEVVVDHSAWVQELIYQKPQLLAELTQRVPDERINDLRFRVEPLDNQVFHRQE